MRNSMMTICLVVVIMGGIFICGCFSTSQSDKAGSEENMLKLSSAQTLPGETRIISFNIRNGANWSGRKEMVFDVLKKSNADIIGLQEGEPGQVEDIKKVLAEYSFYSIGRNDGKQKGESCPIFYKKDKFNLLDSGTFWFSRDSKKPGSQYFGTVFPRICSWVLLSVKSSGEKFYAYNMHLDAFSNTARGKSMEVLSKQLAEERKHKDYPIIIMGDFNMALENSAMKPLLDGGFKIKDTFKCLYPGEQDNIGTRHYFTGRRNGLKIDHIFASENVGVLESGILHYNLEGKYPSDHFPVVAKVKM